MLNRLLFKLSLSLFGLLLLAYVGVCAYLFVNQRDMLYMAPTVAISPQVEGVPIQDLPLKTPDGETLRMWYLAPAQKDGLVFMYLGGQAGSLDQQTGRYRRMAQKGVGFLSLSYRGFSGSTGHPTEEGLFIDVLAAYDWLRSQGYAPEQIVIHGHSLGSGPATYLATQRPARGLILEAPFTAAADVAQSRYPYIPVELLMIDKFANRNRIKAVTMPVLIVHGDRDTVIPFEHSERLYALANNPKTFKRMTGEDHSTLTRHGVYDVYWSWLSAN